MSGRARTSPPRRRPEVTAGPGEWAKHVADEANELRGKVLEVNKQISGPLDSTTPNSSRLPIVLILGNHSSGKSTFINYALGKAVQSTGVAPTDDGFTVIQPGRVDVQTEGPTFLGDEREGFAPLSRYGEDLANHFVCKKVTGLKVQDLMFVDSPGMIDSTEDRKGAGRERGYDFLGAVKWLAQEADVVLFFFDPFKPGTTGETLDCLTKSLAGIDFKLHIIMNKVDSFDNVHDFARAYGSLCWNLSKVIPRKDMPPIHTMYIPTSAGAGGQPGGSADASNVFRNHLCHTIKGVLDFVKEAPRRRADNLITRTIKEVQLLLLHTEVMAVARRELTRLNLRCLAFAVLLAATAVSAWAAAETVAPPPVRRLPTSTDEALVLCLSVCVALLVVLLPVWTRLRARLLRRLVTEEHLNHLFKRSERGEVRVNRVGVPDDEMLLAQWSTVRPHVRNALPALRTWRGASMKQLAVLSEVVGDMNELRDKVKEVRELPPNPRPNPPE